MFAFTTNHRRRSKSAGFAPVSADVLESRQLLSGANQLHAALAGNGAATGTGDYEVESEHGRTQRSFEVEVYSATASTTYPVSVAGVVVGQLTTNSIGRGKLEFKDSPEAGHRAFPANWPGLANGTSVSVDGLVSGTIGNSVGGLNDGDGDNDGDGANDTDGDHGNGDGNDGNDGHGGSGIDFSNENGEAGLYGTLTGAGVQIGSAGFSTENEHGVVKREFEVRANNLTPGTTYPVTLDGVAVGSVVANAVGYGRLKLSEAPHFGETAFPASFPSPTVNSTVALGTVLTGALSGYSGNSATGVTNPNSDHVQVSLTGTGTMAGIADSHTELLNNGSASSTEFEVDVWNGTAGAVYNVTIDGIVVGTITIDARGYGQLVLGSSRGQNNFPANWPGVHNSSVIALGTAISGTVDSTKQLAAPSERELQDAYEIDHRLGLNVASGLYENWGDRGEKWLRGSDKQWYFVTPDGTLYEWDHGSSATGTVVQQLDPAIYQNPALLYNAQPVVTATADATAIRYAAANADHDLGLTTNGNYFENWGHQGEKWVHGNDGWYYITPDGSLYKWDGSATASGTLMVGLDSSYHADPTSLTNAMSTLTAAEEAHAADRGLGLVNATSQFLNWGGRSEKWAKGNQNAWYFVLPNGELYEWNHTAKAEGKRVANLSSQYYDNLNLLTSAASVSTAAHEAILDDVFAELHVL